MRSASANLSQATVWTRITSRLCGCHTRHQQAVLLHILRRSLRVPRSTKVDRSLNLLVDDTLSCPVVVGISHTAKATGASVTHTTLLRVANTQWHLARLFHPSVA